MHSVRRSAAAAHLTLSFERANSLAWRGDEPRAHLSARMRHGRLYRSQ